MSEYQKDECFCVQILQMKWLQDICLTFRTTFPGLLITHQNTSDVRMFFHSSEVTDCRVVRAGVLVTWNVPS